MEFWIRQKTRKEKKMKGKLTFLFVSVLLILTSTSIFAQLVEDNFEYVAGSPITNYGWTANGNPGVNTILVVEPGLDFPCYAGSGIGNACALNSSGPDAFKFLTHSINTGRAFVSFMVKVSEAQTGDYFFHLSDSTGGFNSDIGRVYAKDSSGKFAFGLNKEGNNNEVWTPAQYTYDSTYLILMIYKFVPGNDNDLVSLIILSDCPPLLEPVATLGPTGLGQDDLPEVGKVTLRQGSESHAPTLIIDGIYANTTYEATPLPVELTQFTSAVNNRDVTLNWATSTELNNRGFEIERSNDGAWSRVDFVNGNGTSSVQNNYSYTDRNLSSGRYSYRLKQIDFNGNFEYFNLHNDVIVGVPVSMQLSQNYPNPFNPTTTINFDLPNDGYVSLKVFDNSGKEVATLVNGIRTSGYHSVNFNAADLSSGIYYYKLSTNGVSKVMKMALIK